MSPTPAPARAPSPPATGAATPYRRWFLLLSLAAGLAYPWLDGRLGPAADVILKGLGVGALAIVAICASRTNPAFHWLAAIMAAGAAGDMLLEVPAGFIAGAGAFAIGHCIAMAFYAGQRRQPLPAVDRILAAGLVAYGLAMPGLVMPAGASVGAPMLYSVLLCGMAAAALLSRFPRRWVFAGALLFVLSDTFLIMRLGGSVVGDARVHGLIVWYCYYFGQAMIFFGVEKGLKATP